MAGLTLFVSSIAFFPTDNEAQIIRKKTIMKAAIPKKTKDLLFIFFADGVIDHIS